MKNWKFINHPLTWVIGVTVLLAACTAPTPAPTPTPEISAPTAVPVAATDLLEPIGQEVLTGSTWQWLGGRENPSSPVLFVLKPEKYTLTFNEDGTLFVQADCNTSRGTYTLSGDQLTITLGATTLMACEPGSLSDQFLAELGQVARAGLGFGNLVFILADGVGQMYFQATEIADLAAELEPITQQELVDILWQWTNLVETTPPGEIGVGIPENYDLVFRADGTYNAKADCNRLNGTYDLVGSQLTLNPGLTTLAACEPESMYDQYMNLLWRVTGVGTRDGLLVLLLDDGSAAMSFVNGGASPVASAPQPVEGDPALILGQPDGIDNFDNANNWTEFNNSCFTTQVTGGQFVMTANGQPGTVCWEVSWPQLENFYIETAVQIPQTCNPQDRFGLFFRAPDLNRGYMYGFTCAGEYSLTIWDGNATTVLVEPTLNTAIINEPQAINRMGLMAFGSNISMYANGAYLQTVTDYTFLAPGRLGYFVRAATDAPFTVRYDQIRVWVLEDELYPPSAAQPIPPVELPAPAPNTPTAVANVNVNIRTGPGTRFPIIGTATQGDTSEILGTTPDGFWYAISVPTTQVGTGVGWSSADFWTLNNPTGQPLPVITPPLLPTTVNFPPPAASAPQVVMREPATLRSGPTLEFPVFGVATTGSRAEVVGESNDREWWAVRIPTTLASNGVGWINKMFTTTSNVGAVPVLPTPNLPNNITPAAPASGAPSLVTMDTLNVRTGPGNEYPSLGRVSRGTVLAVLGVSPDRAHFVVNIPTNLTPSGQGWVPAQWVRAENVGNVPVVQPPPAP